MQERMYISEDKLRIWMAIRGVKRYEDLAKMSGLSVTTVYSSLDSDKFRGKTVEAIARALKVHPFDIIEAEGYPDPHLDASASDYAVAS